MKDPNDVYRRDAVSFDSRYFEKEQKAGNNYSLEETFNHINAVNLWGSSESASGEGSTAAETEYLKSGLQKLIEDFQVKSILDAGCGDFGWIRTLNLTNIKYCGIDLLEDTISRLQHSYKNNGKFEFIRADVSQAMLPKTDLILCRDCLVHLSFYDIKKMLANFRKSGSKYLLTTTFVNARSNDDIITGDWRTINLQLKPFNFPSPLVVIKEGCMQNNGLYKDKSLALWELKKI